MDQPLCCVCFRHSGHLYLYQLVDRDDEKLTLYLAHHEERNLASKGLIGQSLSGCCTHMR